MENSTNYLWIYWLIIGVFAILPFLFLYIDYREHKGSIKYTLLCPVFGALSGSSVAALLIALHFYPSGMGLISIFVFCMGLPIATIAQDLSSANRVPDSSKV